MTIPLDNLYDYIFSLTGHTNKNLIMYRFDPHGSKNIKNLIVHNNIDKIYITLPNGSKKMSWHYKLLFCYDQEPLDYDLYASTYFDNSRKKIFCDTEGVANQFNNPIGERLVRKENISGHAEVPPSIYDKKLLLHSEKNSIDLKKYEKNGFLGIYYWSHAFIALDWYRFAEHDKLLDTVSKTNFNKDFNVYCRAWTGSREYRLKFLELLNQNSIDKKSNIFFNEYCDENHYSVYELKNKDWKFQINNIDNLTCKTKRQPSGSASATYDVDDYKNSAIDIVLETVFNQNKIQLTEKILRPIACGKPFILVSEKSSLEYLKSYGFKTFSGLIDESYDDIECPKRRLEKIIQIMKSISVLPQNKKDQLFSEMHEIAEFNKKWVFSENFFNIINSELKKNLKNGLDTLDKPEYQTASVPKFHYRVYRKYRKYLSNDVKKFADMIIGHYSERIKLSKKNISIS